MTSIDPQAPLGPGVPPRPVSTPSNGRPRALDVESKRSIAMLIVEGYSLEEAAAYMACDRKTIYNERRRDEHFDFSLRRAYSMRNMEPLNTIRCAAKTNWRAAAWLVDYRGKVEKEKRDDNQDRFDRLELFADRPHGALNDADEIPTAAHAEPVAESLAASLAVPAPIPEAVAVAEVEEPIAEPTAEPAAEQASVEPQPAARVFSPSAVESRVDAIIAAMEVEMEAQARQRLRAAERLFGTPAKFPRVGKKSAGAKPFSR